VDDAWDGLYATLLTDKIVYYNPTSTAINRTIAFPAGAVAAQPDLRVRPNFNSFTANVEPNSIAAVNFEPLPQEMLFQCEGFRTLGGLTPTANSEFHPGLGPTHVLLPAGRAISTKIRIETPGQFRLFYRTTRSGKLAAAEVLIDGKTLTGAAKAASAWGQTMLAGTTSLKAGVYTLTIRPPAKQSIRADFIILTTDTSVSGYSFAEK
jgi:hypothetical protein